MKKDIKWIIVSSILFVSLMVLGACTNNSNKNHGAAQGNSKRNYGTDYQKACEDLDFEIAHEILNGLRKSAMKTPLNNVVSMKYKEYEEADLYIFKQECTYLLESGLEGAEEVIIKLISDTPFDGTRIDEGDYEGTSIYNNLSNDKGEESLYVHCINRYNKKCDYALEMANVLKKEGLMDNLIAMYKDNIAFQTSKRTKELVGGEFGEVMRDMFGTNKVEYTLITYESRDKDAAISKYNLNSPNANNSITLQTTKISGPLGKFFEIVPNEKGYKINKRKERFLGFTVEIKRIKAGKIVGDYDYIRIILSLLDDDNSVQFSEEKSLGASSELLSLEVGESTYLSFDFYNYHEKDITSITHFKIGSSKSF